MKSKDVQLQKLCDARTNNLVSSRANLLTSGTSAFADGGTTSWAADDDDDKLIDTQICVVDLMTQQDRILEGINFDIFYQICIIFFQYCYRAK